MSNVRLIFSVWFVFLLVLFLALLGLGYLTYRVYRRLRYGRGSAAFWTFWDSKLCVFSCVVLPFLVVVSVLSALVGLHRGQVAEALGTVRVRVYEYASYVPGGDQSLRFLKSAATLCSRPLVDTSDSETTPEGVSLSELVAFARSAAAVSAAGIVCFLLLFPIVRSLATRRYCHWSEDWRDMEGFFWHKFAPLFVLVYIGFAVWLSIGRFTSFPGWCAVLIVALTWTLVGVTIWLLTWLVAFLLMGSDPVWLSKRLREARWSGGRWRRAFWDNVWVSVPAVALLISAGTCLLTPAPAAEALLAGAQGDGDTAPPAPECSTVVVEATETSVEPEMVEETEDEPLAIASEAFTGGTLGEHWAVVIGISKYKDSHIPRLRYASKDAEEFHEWIVSPDGGRHAPARTRLLMDRKATYARIREALFTWLGQALEEDIVTVYFAGHGSPQSPGRQKNLFLLPYDVRYDNIGDTGFPMWDIQTALKRFIKARRVVVIADACHSGGVGESFDAATRGHRGVGVNPISGGLRQLSAVGDGVCVISASDDKQLSQEGRKWGGHGVFTHYLLRGLRGEADSTDDGRVNLGELIMYLSQEVRRATKGEQCPTVAGRFDPALTLARPAMEE